MDRALWDLVRRGDQQCLVRLLPGLPEAVDVGELALPPGLLAALVVQRVAAGGHHPAHRLAELVPDGLENIWALSRRGVLDRVVQQCRDRLVLAAAVLQHQRADAHQVGEVGHPGALAEVEPVPFERELERVVERGGQGAGAEVLPGLQVVGRGGHRAPLLGIGGHLL
jgi:hypothetical protein